jgi:hypothetical protein
MNTPSRFSLYDPPCTRSSAGCSGSSPRSCSSTQSKVSSDSMFSSVRLVSYGATPHRHCSTAHRARVPPPPLAPAPPRPARLITCGLRPQFVVFDWPGRCFRGFPPRTLLHGRRL